MGQNGKKASKGTGAAERSEATTRERRGSKGDLQSVRGVGESQPVRSTWTKNYSTGTQLGEGPRTGQKGSLDEAVQAHLE